MEMAQFAFSYKWTILFFCEWELDNWNGSQQFKMDIGLERERTEHVVRIRIIKWR